MLAVDVREARAVRRPARLSPGPAAGELARFATLHDPQVTVLGDEQGALGRIRELVAASPDLTLAEIRDRLALAVSLSTLWAAVRGLGLTVKKKSSAPRSKTART